MSVHRRDRCSYFSLIHTAQPRSRFSAQNFSSLRSRNTARYLCLVLRSSLGLFRLVRASDTFCQDFVLVCLSIDVTGALVLLFYLHCTSWFLFLFFGSFSCSFPPYWCVWCTCTFSLLALVVACFASSFPVLVVFFGPLPALLRLSTCRRPCIIHNSSFCCSWTCVTTWRKPWRRWTENFSLFWLFSCTCVSVHRRDRCTCTPHTSGLPFAVLFVLLFLLLWLWVVV